MREVYIVSVARTPIGNLNGVFANISAVELGKIAIEAALQRAGILPEHIEEVFMGNVLTANNGQAPARQAALAAGLPMSVPCTTVNKVCASGMKAIMLGTQAILLGDRDVVVAGGMESMSLAPHYLPNSRAGLRYGNGTLVDAIVRDGLQDPYDGRMMGDCAEVCSSGKGISREAQDAYAFESYRRARLAYAEGWLDAEIAPVAVPRPKQSPLLVTRDEEVDNRRIHSVADMQALRSVFKKDGTVTAGNASKINDGAAAVVLMSKEKADALGIAPLARVVSYADAAQEPVWFTTTPSLAMPKAVEKAGVSMAAIDAFEINEAFAVVALANAQGMNIPLEKLNVFGGAVAMGHPIGASGARIVITLLSVLRQNGGKLGLAGICNGGGGASALLIERM